MQSQSSGVYIYLGCSLDGFIAGTNNELDWLMTDYSANGDLSASANYIEYPEFISKIGCLLMGRTTFDVVNGFETWPYGDMPVLVASNRQILGAPASVRHVSGAIADLVAEAKMAANGKGVYLDGGNLARQAIDAGLVDEITLTILPVLLGKGVRLFDSLHQSRLLQFTQPAASGKGHIQISAKITKASEE